MQMQMLPYHMLLLININFGNGVKVVSDVKKRPRFFGKRLAQRKFFT